MAFLNIWEKQFPTNYLFEQWKLSTNLPQEKQQIKNYTSLPQMH